mgnify:CR=1 FL=1
MGNNQSAYQSHLSCLVNSDLDEDSVYWESFFTYEFPMQFQNDFRATFHNFYSSNPVNFHIGTNVCVKKLDEQIGKLDDNFSPAIFYETIRSMTSFLHYIIPEIIASKSQDEVFKDESGERLAFLITKLLERKIFSLGKNAQHWYENSVNENHYDEFRLMLVQILIMLKTININFDINPDFGISVTFLLKYYFNTPLKKSLTLQRELINASLNLLLVINNFNKLDLYVISRNELIEEDYNEFVLSLSLCILKKAKEDPMSVDNRIRKPLSLMLLNLISINPTSDYIEYILFTLLYAYSFTSLSIEFNVTNISLFLKYPIHRGTYADTLIELLSKVNPKYYKLVSLIISAIIPYTQNLSYLSSITIINILKLVFTKNDFQLTRAMIKAIHYLINRSVRDNIPFIILLIKNSSLILNIKNSINDFEECEQI